MRIAICDDAKSERRLQKYMDEWAQDKAFDYEVEALQYLIKPVRRDKLFAALNQSQKTLLCS